MAQVCPFVPSQDMDISVAFYEALGFTTQFRDKTIAVMDFEGATILIQPYWVKDWAHNWMAQLRVTDLDAWWKRIAEVQATYNPGVCKPPEVQPWGLKVAFLSDPAGVLWHVTEA
ncbi:MAG: glyoxalase [Erythrobacter sp.]|nr:MAG: glyoxalase [Erythrobacter sp.]